MRILRIRSNQEVSSTGFALFIVGLILAGFIGGAIRTVLSSEQIQSRILSELQNALPDLQVKMDTASVSLARGIWPGLSIRIPKLHLIKPEVCGQTHGRLELEDIVLPLSFMHLLRNEVYWDTVTVERMALVYSRKVCPPGAIEKPLVPVPPKPDETAPESLMDSAEKIRKHIAHGFEFAQQLQNHLHGVDVHRLQISSSDDPSWLITVTDLSLRTGSHLFVSSQVHFERSFPAGRIEHEAAFSANADKDRLKWEVKSPLKEGVIEWTGVASRVDDRLEQRLDIHQLPFKDVLDELQVVTNGPKGTSPRSLWLTCQASQVGALSAFKTAPTEISDCKVDGEGQQIKMAPGQQFWLWERTPLHQPLKIEVAHLSVQSVLDYLARPGIPAIVTKPGRWSGEIQFSNPRSWQLDGSLEGLEVVFSNQSIRGKQLVNELKMQVQSEEKGVHAKLFGLALAEGASDGQVEFHFSPDFQSGDWNVNLASVTFSPMIQSLMIGGVTQSVSLNGVGQIEGGEVKSWKGHTQIKAIDGHGWHVDDAKVETNYKDGDFSIKAHTAVAELKPDFLYWDSVRSVLGATVDSLRLGEGTLTADLSKVGGEIKDLRLHVLAGHVYHFRGSWARGGELNGQFNDDAGKRWRVQGNSGQLLVEEAH